MSGPVHSGGERRFAPESAPDSGETDEKGDLESRGFEGKDLQRADELRGHMHQITVGCVWAGAVALAGMAGCLVWHLVLPERWGFLSAAQISKIETILIAAMGSKFVSDRAKKLG